MHNTPEQNEDFRRAFDATNARWKAQNKTTTGARPMNLQPIQKTPAADRYLCAACNQWRAVFADLDGEPFKAYYCDQCAAELTAKQEPTE
jgi:predicted SprT family Zn-dependent metalloprotease